MSNQYSLLDSGNFQKLEQVGPFRLVRPAAQAVWRPRLSPQEWEKADASFQRFSGGDGKWSIKNRKVSESWNLRAGKTTFVIKVTDFGHLGIFPEQDKNWETLATLVQKRLTQKPGDFNVLNLFAYTGGSTLATAAAGAKVVHVDASKTSVAWARENAAASGMGELPIRWIIEDVQKFVGREVRRGSKYHGIILDPPTFGRGTNNEVWQIEEHLSELLDNLKLILADDFHFVLLSAHSTGYTPLALKNILQQICPEASGTFDADEMLVAEQDGGRPLPSGASCLFVRRT